MRAMSSIHQALTVTLVLGLMAGTVQAGVTSATSPSQPVKIMTTIQTVKTGNLVDPRLAEVHSFEVQLQEPMDFSSHRQDIPPELIEYTRTALLADDHFHYDSHAQGILRLSCSNSACTQIRGEVRQGPDGDVLWRHTEHYPQNTLLSLNFVADSTRIAKKMVKQLATDYENALKASPTKIQIREE